ncbi:MAG TPA: hypothetical protein VFQ16_10115, partial [Burkholderiaceae bacterium]|nr:hypothetical protein [Burkholderiaceae bacterium]
MNSDNTPSRQDIHHELRARLLADVLRQIGIFGERAACALIGKKIDHPVGLVARDPQYVLQRAP